jgi:hypothetical protein
LILGLSAFHFLHERIIQIRARVTDLALFPLEETYLAVSTPTIQYLRAQERVFLQSLIVLDHLVEDVGCGLGQLDFSRSPQGLSTGARRIAFPLVIIR